MAKKRKKTNRKNPSSRKINLKIINIILLLVILLMAIIIYILFNINSKEYVEKKQPIKIVKKEETKIKDEFDEYFEKIEEKRKNQSEITHKKITKENDKNLDEKSKKEEINKEKIQNKPLKKDTKSKAKLVIIFDDVTTQTQINKIKNIGYTTTISVMPPTNKHPNSAKIVKTLPFYMIHFPLEATHFKGEEQNTLHIGDSYEKIDKRVAQIRKWYPNAKYTNNHTGSKFTSHEESMNKLFKALKKYNFIFMDSKTTSKTVAKQMAEKYNMPYIVRNIFLDNKQDFDYIQNQLKKAIKIARDRGYAIAICHPHLMTIKTLKQSKNLLKDLDLIQLDQLPILER